MNIQDGLYHVETGLPWHLFEPFAGKAFGLEYSHHARQAALDDRYGQLTSAPLSHAFTRTEVFEVEVLHGRIVKFAARLSAGYSVECSRNIPGWGKHYDLILVCTPSAHDRNNLFVKTLWLQEREDSHKTLDKSKYLPPVKNDCVGEDMKAACKAFCEAVSLTGL